MAQLLCARCMDTFEETELQENLGQKVCQKCLQRTTTFMKKKSGGTSTNTAAVPPPPKVGSGTNPVVPPPPGSGIVRVPPPPSKQSGSGIISVPPPPKVESGTNIVVPPPPTIGSGKTAAVPPPPKPGSGTNSIIPRPPKPTVDRPRSSSTIARIPAAAAVAGSQPMPPKQETRYYDPALEDKPKPQSDKPYEPLSEYPSPRKASEPMQMEFMKRGSSSRIWLYIFAAFFLLLTGLMFWLTFDTWWSGPPWQVAEAEMKTETLRNNSRRRRSRRSRHRERATYVKATFTFHAENQQVEVSNQPPSDPNEGVPARIMEDPNMQEHMAHERQFREKQHATKAEQAKTGIYTVSWNFKHDEFKAVKDLAQKNNGKIKILYNIYDPVGYSQHSRRLWIGEWETDKFNKKFDQMDGLAGMSLLITFVLFLIAASCVAFAMASVWWNKRYIRIFELGKLTLAETASGVKVDPYAAVSGGLVGVLMSMWMNKKSPTYWTVSFPECPKKVTHALPPGQEPWIVNKKVVVCFMRNNPKKAIVVPAAVGSRLALQKM